MWWNCPMAFKIDIEEKAKEVYFQFVEL